MPGIHAFLPQNLPGLAVKKKKKTKWKTGAGKKNTKAERREQVNLSDLEFFDVFYMLLDEPLEPPLFFKHLQFNGCNVFKKVVCCVLNNGSKCRAIQP